MKVFSRQNLENNSVSPLFPILWTLFPLALYLFLRAMPHYDHHWHLVKLHFYAGSTVLMLAAVVSVVIGMIGTRLRNVQIIFASLAFLSLAAVFGMHALSTPGFILEMNRIVGVTVQLSITLTALWLFASSLPSSNPFIQGLSRFHTFLVPGWTALLLGGGIIVFTNPELAALLPVDSNPFKFVLGFISLELFVLVAWRYWQSYHYNGS